ncbi:hypothetical protein P7K49_012100 [Saguinus oedipus]|uniref:Uncharacterized protein n=1 Tax=Saguinus oedipus TaxID=9490 RepID=A0ABQ9VSJ8_SAGOE|nr:hypothetical protein P7K49_012100 [Saguinus oedipus]
MKDVDKFGNEITQLARPLPVEYLIIDHGLLGGTPGATEAPGSSTSSLHLSFFLEAFSGHGDVAVSLAMGQQGWQDDPLQQPLHHPYQSCPQRT